MNRMLQQVKSLVGRLSRRHASAPERPAEFYDELYRSWEIRNYWQSPYYSLWAVIADRIRRDGWGRVLEVGSGVGLLASLLLDSGLEHYLGFDFNPLAIEQARRYVPRGEFIVADARTTSIFDEYDYDTVVCTEVLEHIEDDMGVLRRIRPGRRVLASVPNFPYISHVRHFRDAREVAERYGSVFHTMDVMTLRSIQAGDYRFFLLDGIRNDVPSLR